MAASFNRFADLLLGKANRWFLAILLLVILLVALYATRQELFHGVVAVSIARAKVFAPPPDLPDESWPHRLRDRVEFYWDVANLRIAREKRIKQLQPQIQPLIHEVVRRQAAGKGMQYSMHIYREIRWRMNFTPDLQTTETRIADLRRSLDQPEEQLLAEQQQSSDGSWGLGLDVFYLRLYYSVEDGLDRSDAHPQYPLRFLDRINSPEQLTAQLDSARFDHFTKTGTFNREELDETFSAVARLLFRLKDVPYNFDPRLRATLRDYVDQWQNPETGYWGQWMIDREGRVWKMDDMAMTFHVVSDLNGEVGHLDRIANRTLQLDKVNFPSGIRFNGHYENHLNWDAVKILRLAWPHLDDATKVRAQHEISQMLDWCLKDSYQPDGSFKVSELDDTAGDANMYGALFLRELGYFDPKRRFWSSQQFPEADALRARIESYLKATGLNDPGMKSAYDALQASQ